MNPLISVVIPSFNRLKYIPSAIESAFQCGLENLEVIVVDDGSTDGSLDYLSNLSEQGKICLMTHKDNKNLGQAASINLGLSEAQGEFIAILDSDDFFSKEKFASQVSYLQENPDVGMVYGQGHAIDEDGHFLFEVPADGHQEDSDPNKLLLDCYMALPGGSLIRRSVFDKVGLFEEGFRAGQDHDMALRIMESTKVAYLPRLAFFYRKLYQTAPLQVCHLIANEIHEVGGGQHPSITLSHRINCLAN